jgi:thiamine biosynthesis lipoprotein
MPPGTAIDAGGIGAGLAADMVVEMLLADGVAGAMVAVGGDVRVAGEGPIDGDWVIAVADAFRPERAATHVTLSDGGVATSSTRTQAWQSSDGRPAHHLLDPIRCVPVDVGPDLPTQATVVAGSAMWADVHATMLIVRGPHAALPRLGDAGLGARIVDGGGRALTNRAWATFGIDIDHDPTDPTSRA